MHLEVKPVVDLPTLAIVLLTLRKILRALRCGLRVVLAAHLVDFRKSVQTLSAESAANSGRRRR